MIDLHTFIKKCEIDLVLRRNLSLDTLNLVHDLSNENKILCEPIIAFITRQQIGVENKLKDICFLSKERVLVCRLIPLLFALDTDNPCWSSYMLTQGIKSATNIIGISLSEIGIAFLEIFCEFATPLNRFVYNFCIDLKKEFTLSYPKRFNEVELLCSWGSPSCENIASVAFLRYRLSYPYNFKPKFVLNTMLVLIPNEYFNDIMEEAKYLFEDLEYKQSFLECLFNHSLPKGDENFLLSIIK
jgi:hypothetical protein